MLHFPDHLSITCIFWYKSSQSIELANWNERLLDSYIIWWNKNIWNICVFSQCNRSYHPSHNNLCSQCRLHNQIQTNSEKQQVASIRAQSQNQIHQAVYSPHNNRYSYAARWLECTGSQPLEVFDTGRYFRRERGFVYALQNGRVLFFIRSSCSRRRILLFVW